MNEHTMDSASTRSLGFTSRIAPLVTRSFRGLLGASSRAGNASRVHERLELEHWPVVSDGMHNLTTDLAEFDGYLYLVFSSSPWHIGSHNSRIRLMRSRDGKEWESVREFKVKKGDIRDPKLSVIGDRLLLYVLTNNGWLAEPGSTCMATSKNGVDWTALEPCEPKGWLFWRPKSFDGKEWYLPAYWGGHGKSILLKSTDGVNWREWSTIHTGDHNDETDFEFLPDGTIVATARLEITHNLLGHEDSCTLVAYSEPPYKTWTSVRCPVTRLDGPNLFRWKDQVYALGRRHEAPEGWFQKTAGILGKKRTALFSVSPEGLKHLSDLPSGGDTGYPGVVLRGEELLVSYYTNDIKRDHRWGVGMFMPSEIRLARLSMDNVSAL